jgi:organic hydroperoxide reductase OsmC/OhrA
MGIDSPRDHTYEVTVTWTGNTGTGTSAYRAYERAHEIAIPGKPIIAGSSDPAFRGDKARYNPEELLVGSLSTCHMLWYLHLCSDAGIAVRAYQDVAEGVMIESLDGGGRFKEVVLQPEITVPPGTDLDRARRLHADAHAKCFIANSVNFPVRCEAVFLVGEA